MFCTLLLSVLGVRSLSKPIFRAESCGRVFSMPPPASPSSFRIPIPSAFYRTKPIIQSGEYTRVAANAHARIAPASPRHLNAYSHLANTNHRSPSVVRPRRTQSGPIGSRAFNDTRLHCNAFSRIREYIMTNYLTLTVFRNT